MPLYSTLSCLVNYMNNQFMVTRLEKYCCVSETFCWHPFSSTPLLNGDKAKWKISGFIHALVWFELRQKEAAYCRSTAFVLGSIVICLGQAPLQEGCSMDDWQFSPSLRNQHDEYGRVIQSPALPPRGQMQSEDNSERKWWISPCAKLLMDKAWTNVWRCVCVSLSHLREGHHTRSLDASMTWSVSVCALQHLVKPCPLLVLSLCGPDNRQTSQQCSWAWPSIQRHSYMHCKTLLWSNLLISYNVCIGQQ